MERLVTGMKKVLGGIVVIETIALVVVSKRLNDYKAWCNMVKGALMASIAINESKEEEGA